MKRFTLALVDSHDQAKSVVEKLTLAGFSEHDISVLFIAQDGVPEPAGEKYGTLPEATVIRAGRVSRLLPVLEAVLNGLGNTGRKRIESMALDVPSEL